MQTGLFDAEADWQAGQKLLDIIESAVHRMGVKTFAALINRDPSQIRSALNNGDKHFAVTWLPHLLHRDPIFAKDYIGALCDLAGMKKPEEKTALTPEEKVLAYEAIISAHGLGPIFERAMR